MAAAVVTLPKIEEEIEVNNTLKSLKIIGLAPISAYELDEIDSVKGNGAVLGCSHKYLEKVRIMGYNEFAKKSKKLKSDQFNPNLKGKLSNMEWNQDTTIMLEEKVKIFCTQNDLDGLFLLDIGTSGRSHWYTPIFSLLVGIIRFLFRAGLHGESSSETNYNKVAMANLELFDKKGKSLLKVQTRSYGTFILKGYDVARSATRDAITEMGKAIDFVVK
jgi:hypothetical protein